MPQQVAVGRARQGSKEITELLDPIPARILLFTGCAGPGTEAGFRGMGEIGENAVEIAEKMHDKESGNGLEQVSVAPSALRCSCRRARTTPADVRSVLTVNF